MVTSTRAREHETTHRQTIHSGGYPLLPRPASQHSTGQSMSALKKQLKELAKSKTTRFVDPEAQEWGDGTSAKGVCAWSLLPLTCMRTVLSTHHRAFACVLFQPSVETATIATKKL
jgi:hypothetical protein